MPNEVISAWDNLNSYFPDKEVEVVADVFSKSSISCVSNFANLQFLAKFVKLYKYLVKFSGFHYTTTNGHSANHPGGVYIDYAIVGDYLAKGKHLFFTLFACHSYSNDPCIPMVCVDLFNPRI